MVESINTANINLLNQITKKSVGNVASSSASSETSSFIQNLGDRVSLSSPNDQNLARLQYLDNQISTFADELAQGGSPNFSGANSSALNDGQIQAIAQITSESVALDSDEQVQNVAGSVRSTLEAEDVTLASAQQKPFLEEISS